MEVILFSTNCPKCRVLQKKLDAAKIQYREIGDIEEMLTLGIRQAPMLQVNGELMDFSKATEWVNRQGGSDEYTD